MKRKIKSKVVAISDLHGNLVDVPHCDLLLICGDISPLTIQSDHLQMLKWVFNDFVDWIDTLPCDKVCFTPGNHDLWFAKFCNKNMVKALHGATKGRLQVLIDETYSYGIHTIYGTPWCEKFGNWAYMLNEQELKEKYDRIPKDVDILITHEASTLAGVGETKRGHFNRAFGSSLLTDAINRVKPKYALCGHIHTGTKELTKMENGVTVANCSLLDEDYKLVFKPLEFEIEC